MNLKQNQYLKLDAFGHTLEYRWSASDYLLMSADARRCAQMRADNIWFYFCGSFKVIPTDNLLLFLAKTSALSLAISL